MKLALVALEGNCTNPVADPEQAATEDAAITALRQALETERNDLAKVGEVGVWGDVKPVAWMHTTAAGLVYFRKKPQDKVFNPQPVYTAPPDYERGFVDGMQHQMKSSVDRAINKQPTKILGPNLEEILNRAGFYKKCEWQGLTDEEIDECERLATIRHQRHKYSVRGQIITPADGLEWHFAQAIEAKLKERNHG